MRGIPIRVPYRLALAATLALAAAPSFAASLACTALPDPDETSEGEGTSEEGLTGSMTPGATLQVTTALNLRAEPSTSAAVLEVLAAGTQLTLASGEPSNGFYKVNHDGTVGWSSGKYLEPAASPVDDGADPPAAMLTTGDVNLREGPATTYAVLTVIPMGSQVTPLDPAPVNGFYHITYQGLTGYTSAKYLTADAGAGGVPSSDPVSSAPFANGQLWKFKAKTLAVDVALFVPAAALQAPEVEVMFYAHGLNVCSPVAKSPPLGFLTDAPFHLAKIADQSGRPVVFAVPFMDWEHLAQNGMSAGGSNHKLGVPANLNGVLAEVLAQVGKQRNAAPPALSALYLAGHSRAYSFLNPLAAAAASGDPQFAQGALAKLTQVWALDTGYACYPTSNWTKWMTANPALEITQDYRSGTGTADCGKQFAALVPASNGQLAVHAVPEAHCDVPAVELPKLLSDL